MPMTMGSRQYSDNDMLQMQRDAEMRVREMQDRARQAVDETNSTAPPPPPSMRNRNWSTAPGRQRGYGRNQGRSQNRRPEPVEEPAAPPPPPIEELPPEPPPEKKETTIIGDIMDALGLDEDYLLIIGLLLILINQRADTTLILALAYLLI